MNPLKSAHMAGTGQHTRRREKHKLFAKYVLYGGGLIVLKILVLCFWGLGKANHFAWPDWFGVWLEDHPKSATQIWSFCGSVLAVFTFFLLDKLLHLMVRQKIQSSTSLASVEGWSKLSYHKIFKDMKRPYLSIFSLALWGASIALQSGFTTLITPIPFQYNQTFTGQEIDITSDAFRQWYKTNKQTLNVCDWYYYANINNDSVVYFPSCPAAQDQVAFSTSGMVNAVASGTWKFNTFTRVADSIFNGSTGGVLPLGIVGIQAFMDDLDLPHISDSVKSYNYSIYQQGMSVSVSCSNTSSTGSPISRDIFQYINVTNTYKNTSMAQYSFQYDSSICGSPEESSYLYDTIITPEDRAVGVYMCPPNDTVSDWTLYFRPYDYYAAVFDATSLECKLSPGVTTNLVTYRSDGYMIEQSYHNTTGNSTFVPRDIPGSIMDALLSYYSSKGNFLFDSVISANATIASLYSLTSDQQPSMLQNLESFIVGMFEYQATTSRLMYRFLQANESLAAGNETGSISESLRKPLMGNFTYTRIGYTGSPASMNGLAPTLSFIILAAFYYCVEGWNAEHHHVSDWDPLNPVCLVAAGAAGGAAGTLTHLHGRGDAEAKDEGIKRYKVRFVGEHGLANDAAHGEVIVEQAIPEKEAFLHPGHPGV
ncbi:hypothetical protein IWZ01DRAFT_43850 [Phyllosticta capitalensis]